MSPVSLPNEVLTEILLFLDKDKRKNCKLVSQSWNELISTDPYFKNDRVLKLKNCILSPNYQPLSVLSPDLQISLIKIHRNVSMFRYNQRYVSRVFSNILAATVDVSFITTEDADTMVLTTGGILTMLIHQLKKVNFYGWGSDMEVWYNDNATKIGLLCCLEELTINLKDNAKDLHDGFRKLINSATKLRTLTINRISLKPLKKLTTILASRSFITINLNLVVGGAEYKITNIPTKCLQKICDRVQGIALVNENRRIYPVNPTLNLGLHEILVGFKTQLDSDTQLWEQVKNSVEWLDIVETSSLINDGQNSVSCAVKKLYIDQNFQFHCVKCAEKLLLSLKSVEKLKVCTLNISDEYVEVMVNRLKSLKSLCLHLVCPLNSLEPVLSGPKRKSLAKLRLGIVLSLYASDLKELSRKFPNLTSLHIIVNEFCDPLPLIVRAVLKYLPKLEELTIFLVGFRVNTISCAEVRYILKCISKYGKNLQSIHLPMGKFHKNEAAELFRKCPLLYRVQFEEQIMLRYEAQDIAIVRRECVKKKTFSRRKFLWKYGTKTRGKPTTFPFLYGFAPTLLYR